ncbi:MAG: hypothetical protein ABGZ49_05710 [Akkermansiaceae bacterium]
MPLAAIGAILLWFGWFGFNGGSVLSADPGLIAYVIVTTSLAAAAGGIVTIFVALRSSPRSPTSPWPSTESWPVLLESRPEPT